MEMMASSAETQPAGIEISFFKLTLHVEYAADFRRYPGRLSVVPLQLSSIHPAISVHPIGCIVARRWSVFLHPCRELTMLACDSRKGASVVPDRYSGFAPLRKHISVLVFVASWHVASSDSLQIGGVTGGQAWELESRNPVFESPSRNIPKETGAILADYQLEGANSCR
jgi:hypothetical protein